MKTKIDLERYKRKNLFEAFKNIDIPYFSSTSNVDITNFKEFIDKNGYSFFVSISFLISKSVNNIPELRHRIINNDLFEFSEVDPGYTVLLDDDTFSFCDSRHFDNFAEYRKHADMVISKVKTNPDLSTEEKDHMFFITNIPWFSFTSIVHPHSEKYSSIPVVSIGKYFNQGDSLLAPVGIQVHHGLVDGIHVGKFYNTLAEMCCHPESWLQVS